MYTYEEGTFFIRGAVHLDTRSTLLECFCSTRLIYARALSVWKLKREYIPDEVSNGTVKELKERYRKCDVYGKCEK